MTRTAGRSDKTVTRLSTSSYKVTPTAGACTAAARQIQCKTPQVKSETSHDHSGFTPAHPNTTGNNILTVGNLTQVASDERGESGGLAVRVPLKVA